MLVPPGPGAVVAGQIVSAFRSFAGYFLPTFAGRNARAQSDILNPNAKDSPAPSPAEAAPAESPRFGNLRSKLLASLPGAFRAGRSPAPPEPGRKESRTGGE